MSVKSSDGIMGKRMVAIPLQIPKMGLDDFKFCDKILLLIYFPRLTL